MTTPAPTTTRRHRGRLWLAALATAATGALLMPANANAQNDSYVPDTTTTVPETARRIDVSGFAPVCVRDAPFIEYVIKPIGFTPETTSATMVIKDSNGRVLETREVDTLSGRFIFPGASIDANGNGTGWPGWKRAQDGSWIPDPDSAIIRGGVTITVTQSGLTATTTVRFPTDSGCANPDTGQRCVPGRDPQCTPCYPGINNDSNPADDCYLVTTGSNGTTSFLSIGGAAVGAGLLFVLASRRRSASPTTP